MIKLLFNEYTSISFIWNSIVYSVKISQADFHNSSLDQPPPKSGVSSRCLLMYWDPHATQKETAGSTMVFDCTLEERKTRWLTFGFLILLITQTVTFLGLISGWRFKYPTSSPLETNRQCMACDDLKTSLYNIHNTDKDINALRQRHNSSLCCGDVHNVVRLLTKKELSLQYYDSSTAYSSIIRESFINNCDLEQDFKTPKAKLVGVVDAVPSFIVQCDHSTMVYIISFKIKYYSQENHFSLYFSVI
ncbi:uncharacterized protein LOC128223931 [Mya arenaria]|uniref:uncharacterized protein LOC128223931 n=1 Tax=Mya arenaria TaxID=6604 RepID=UPI0022E8FA79|nr:uncharacterized protein LOC128223931 [Mya arenaria]